MKERAWGHGLGEAREGAGTRVSPWGWQARRCSVVYITSNWGVLPLVQGSGVTGAVSHSDTYKTVLYIGKEDEVGRSAKGVGAWCGVYLCLG